MPAINVLAPYGAGQLQSHVAAQTLFLAVGSAIVGGVLTELPLIPYARQPLILAATGIISSNALGISFGPAPVGGWPANALGVFDGNNNCWMVGALDAPVLVAAGTNLSFDAGALVFAFTNPA